MALASSCPMCGCCSAPDSAWWTQHSLTDRVRRWGKSAGCCLAYPKSKLEELLKLSLFRHPDAPDFRHVRAPVSNRNCAVAMSPVPPQYTGVMPAPNYVNPETRGPALIILGTLFLVLSTVAVCLRCFAHISSRKFGVDDICIVLAWVRLALQNVSPALSR